MNPSPSPQSSPLEGEEDQGVRAIIGEKK